MKRKNFLRCLLGAAVAPFITSCKRRPAVPAATSAKKGDELVTLLTEHTNAVYFVGAAYIGDRLGLFKAMAGAGRQTGQQLAATTGLSERYILEWLRTMAAAGYMEYHAESATFELPPEYSEVLVNEDSSLFSAGLIELAVPDIFMLPRVLAAFRNGKGIPYGDYPPETFEGIERLTKPDYRHRLARRWIPAVPGVAERLEAGGSTADLGSGAGHASIAIASAYPRVQAFGFEPYAPSVARARENATAAGLGERVKFETFDGVHVPGGPYDLITMNHSLHHASQPAELLRTSRQALANGGACLVVEERKSARLEDDIHSPRAGYYGIGLLECLPTALAEGGPGYGTGIAEPDMRALAKIAGFGQLTRVMPDDPLLAFFVLRQ